MTQYLISFPARTMVLSDEEFRQAGIDANAVTDEMRDAGVLVYAEGLNPDIEGSLVHGDGTVAPLSYPDTEGLNGGITVVEVPTRAEAEHWAAKIAVACRCPQELRQFGVDMPDA